jgi:hypothetical protein
MKNLEQLPIELWDDPISQELQDKAVKALEEGKVLYFPALPFQIKTSERPFISPDKVDPTAKNISYDLRYDRLAGTLHTGQEADALKEMLKRYATTSRKFLEKLIPYYGPTLIQGRTSYRPVEIEGRKNPSYRKDDTRLHVDAFPSNPTKGQRILRVFTNINPNGKMRVWRLGEPFPKVAEKFAPGVSAPIPGSAYLMNLLKITKDYRTLYDHYMLHIHDNMKGDISYQQTADQEEFRFPAGSTWIVYTDQVSHAALAGQHVLEQTFYLPIAGIKNQATAPLKVLEKLLNKQLV